jgi:DNA-binding response OmpR family regulator
MSHLILLEDESVLRDELSEFLAGCGYWVQAEASVAGFRRSYDPSRHALAVIDLGLPDGDGLALIQELRSRGDSLGIVVLTASDSARARVAGLGVGCDYYLAKTADLEELAATLAALSRRLRSAGPHTAGAPDELTWVLELRPRRLVPPGCGAIALSEQDLVVLHTLMRDAGAIASRQQIVEALGDDFLSYDQRRLDTQMRRLRRKVDEACGLTLPINTARNAGYRFHAPVLIRA